MTGLTSSGVPERDRQDRSLSPRRPPLGTNERASTCKPLRTIPRSCRLRSQSAAKQTGQAAPAFAVQFVLNYEEGGENCVLHGDAGSEQFLSELFNAASYPTATCRWKGIYEYGSRVGVWRFLREFERRGLPLTIFGVSMALERHPELTAAFKELGHEIACHGWRWITTRTCPRSRARAHEDRHGDHRAPHRQRALAGTPAATPRTPRRLVADHGGFLYDSDYYGDDRCQGPR